MTRLADNLDRAWSNVQSGWRNLVSKASNAITRFTSMARDDDDEATRTLRLNSPDWGLLATEMHESENELHIKIEVPGMDRHDIQLEVTQDNLVISGEKQISHEATHGQYHMTECAYGSFQRQIPLPVSVDPDMAYASYKRGILSIRLPKHSREKSHRINVQSS